MNAPRALALSIALVALAATGAPRAAGQAPAVKLAPEMGYATPDGTVRQLGGQPGIVHFVFVARWCAPCEADVQALRHQWAAMRNSRYQIVLVGVNRRQTSQEFADWVRALSFDGAQIYDGDGRLEHALGVEMLPWHVVVGPGRRVLASGDRAPDTAALQRWIGAAS